MAKHVLILLWLCRVVVNDTLTCIGVELTWCVPRCYVLFGWCIAMSFLSMQVQQLWTFHVLDSTEYAHQLFDIVTIERTKVTDIHAIEDVLLVSNGTLDSIRQALDAIFAVVIHQSFAAQPLCGLEFDGIIGSVRVQSQQIFLHSTHTTVYRHVVVVQDNQQVVGTRRNIV